MDSQPRNTDPLGLELRQKFDRDIIWTLAKFLGLKVSRPEVKYTIAIEFSMDFEHDHLDQWRRIFAVKQKSSHSLRLTATQ
jgi:hypothetical protein